MEDSVRIDLIGIGLAWENVTKVKTNSAGNALLEIAPRVAAMESMLAGQEDLRDEIARLRTQRDYLLSAARRTLDENGHLADGENCTLIALKRAVETLAATKTPNVCMDGKTRKRCACAKFGQHGETERR